MKSESGDSPDRATISPGMEPRSAQRSPGATPRPDDRRSWLSLRFLDPELETLFLQETHEGNVPWMLGSLIVGLLLMGAFYGVDRVLIPEQALEAVTRIRFFFMVPIGIAAAAMILTIRRASIVIPMLSCLFLAFGLGWTGVLIASGADAAAYVSAAMAQTVLFAYVCLGIPFRWAVGVVVGMVGAMVVALVTLDANTYSIVFVGGTLTAIAVVATLGAYRYEWTVRDRFIGELLYKSEYELRLASEQDRSQWLGTIAGFVRHELKNAMAGIGSSLQLVSRSPLDERNREVVNRAERSLQFMRQVLQQVGDATSLATALRRQESEALCLSDLVMGCVEDFRLQRPSAELRAELQAGIFVHGNADSLVQMLDKILNNSLEHAEPGTAVSISLREVASWAQLEVTDHGDPLPEAVERLFQPFVSSKAGGADGNLGLGLYIAKVIATHHGGDIAAEPVAAPVGARFIVRLPRLEGTADTTPGGRQ